MRHIVLLLLCLTLIGCGTAPSKQQDAQQYAEETTAKRQGINALRYGQSIETVHAHLSESYIPWADYKSGENTYFIDSFRVPHAKEYNEFFALYKNKKLIAVTPIKKTDAIHPRIIKAYCFSLFDNEGICERGLSDTYWSGFIKQLQISWTHLHGHLHGHPYSGNGQFHGQPYFYLTLCPAAYRKKSHT